VEKRHPNHPGKLSADQNAEADARSRGEINARARALKVLLGRKLPLMVGGAYAFARYTGIYRDTKDLDLYLRQPDALVALEILAKQGWRTERTDETWIYKAFRGPWFVDLLFSSGNGMSVVDDDWFRYAVAGEVFGQSTRLIPAEEMIWSKGFVLERERYDGADVAHLIKSRGPQLDWERLLRRFEGHWEVLFSHLLLYRYVYPSERTAVPNWVMERLLQRAEQTIEEGNWKSNVCRGPFLSRANYVLDVGDWGYRDGRALEELERERQSDGTRPELESPRRSSG